jgi:hypothetical protein
MIMMMLNILKRWLTLIVIPIFVLTSCGLVQQGTELQTFANCDFRLESVTELKLAGVDIQGKGGLADLGFTGKAVVAGSIASGALPLMFNLNVEAKNPNTSLAAMNRLDWILLVDKQELARGVLADRIEIAPNGMTTFPVSIQLDLMEAISGESSGALMNLAFSLAGTGAVSKVTLKAKPTIIIREKPMQFPGYINITEKFGGN